MVLAYVFWHQPRAGIDQDRYEQALRQFQTQLGTAAVDGLIDCWSIRTPELPWLRAGGYEDWYLVTDFAALGHLNAGAVDADHDAAHDPIARAAGFGTGALYATLAGDPQRRRAQRAWFTKPDGRSYAELHAGASTCADQGATLWQRQLVLGPAPEYCLVGSPPAPSPSGWPPPDVRSAGTLLV